MIIQIRPLYKGNNLLSTYTIFYSMFPFKIAHIVSGFIFLNRYFDRITLASPGPWILGKRIFDRPAQSFKPNFSRILLNHRLCLFYHATIFLMETGNPCLTPFSFHSDVISWLPRVNQSPVVSLTSLVVRK